MLAPISEVMRMQENCEHRGKTLTENTAEGLVKTLLSCCGQVECFGSTVQNVLRVILDLTGPANFPVLCLQITESIASLRSWNFSFFWYTLMEECQSETL